LGYDDWPGGDCNTSPATPNALYQVAVPHAIWGAHLNSATIMRRSVHVVLRHLGECDAGVTNGMTKYTD